MQERSIQFRQLNLNNLQNNILKNMGRKKYIITKIFDPKI